MIAGRITMRAVQQRQRVTKAQHRVDFLRKWADELRNTGDCDLVNEAHRLDCEADEAEAWLELEAA